MLYYVWKEGEREKETPKEREERAMTRAWYKDVANYETGYKRVGDLTDEELDKYEFYIEMADRWNDEQSQTIDAIRAERRERRQNKA